MSSEKPEEHIIIIDDDSSEDLSGPADFNNSKKKNKSSSSGISDDNINKISIDFQGKQLLDNFEVELKRLNDKFYQLKSSKTYLLIYFSGIE